ncbi:MAG: GNAT family N-acetyltransferase [Pseudomonadota bacterium]
MTETLVIRATGPADLAAVDALLARSYPKLLKGEYPPSVMVTAVPMISRARPGLVCSGTYFLAETVDGSVLGAGGWTRTRGFARRAEIRHVATDPDHVRRGVASALFRHIFATAEEAGVREYECLATRTAVPFYQAMGFVEVGPTTVPLAPGIAFPAVRMVRAA